MAIEQVKVGFDNFSYIIYCPIENKAAIVDPSYSASKTLDFLSSRQLELKYIINTHYHGNHISETQKIKNSAPSSQVVASISDGEKMGVKIDINVSDGDNLNLGKIKLDFILTPGHTPGGICIIVDNKAILTGDTLFIGDCGRTDLPGGDLNQMYETLHVKIMNLPDNLIVYPGHDYGDKPFDTLGNLKPNLLILIKDIGKNLKM